MAWSNVFDVGACNVFILTSGWGTPPALNQTLVKGSSAPVTIAGIPCTVAVDANGVVSLATDGSALPSTLFEMLILPAGGLPAAGHWRLSGIYICSNMGLGSSNAGSNVKATCGSTAGISDTFDWLARNGTAGASPDPCSLPVTGAGAGFEFDCSTSVTPDSGGLILKASLEIVATPVAPNVALTAPYNSGGGGLSSVSPVITDGGSEITPDALSIAVPPENGNASVQGLSLLYTPNVGFSGSDSFSYFATVGGINSNTATVSITVPTSSPAAAFWTDLVGCVEFGVAPAPSPAPPDSPPGSALISGTAVTLVDIVTCYGSLNLSACVYWTITVPAGGSKLKVVLGGNTAQASSDDLYLMVKLGSPPNVELLSDVDGASAPDADFNKNSPSLYDIEIANPAAGTYYIVLDTAETGLTLTATVF